MLKLWCNAGSSVGCVVKIGGVVVWVAFVVNSGGLSFLPREIRLLRSQL